MDKMEAIEFLQRDLIKFFNANFGVHCGAGVQFVNIIDEFLGNLKPISPDTMLGWKDAQKELPVTPFLAYWTDGRVTVLEEGDSVSYAITGDPEKRVMGWIPLSEIGKPAFAK